jgi:hypothetical protein
MNIGILTKNRDKFLINKFPAFYGSKKCITLFKRARHWSLSWTKLILFTPSRPTSFKSILILSSHVRLRLACGIFRCGFPTTILYTFLTSPMRTTCPVHHILLDLILIIFGEYIKIRKYVIKSNIQDKTCVHMSNNWCNAKQNNTNKRYVVVSILVWDTRYPE